MKCFLHEALIRWGYAAGQCIIDNTNLARLRGTGMVFNRTSKAARSATAVAYRAFMRHC